MKAREYAERMAREEMERMARLEEEEEEARKQLAREMVEIAREKEKENAIVR